MTDMGICHYAHDRIEISSPLLSLMVEPPKGTESLTIHMVRVLSLSLMVEYLKVLWSSASGPLLNSRACLRILISRAPLPVLISRAP
jgi:hypothetical protein